MCDKCDKLQAEILALEILLAESVESNECDGCKGHKFKNLKSYNR